MDEIHKASFTSRAMGLIKPTSNQAFLFLGFAWYIVIESELDMTLATLSKSETEPLRKASLVVVSSLRCHKN